MQRDSTETRPGLRSVGSCLVRFISSQRAPKVDLRSVRHPHRCAPAPESHRVPRTRERRDATTREERSLSCLPIGQRGGTSGTIAALAASLMPLFGLAGCGTSTSKMSASQPTASQPTLSTRQPAAKKVAALASPSVTRCRATDLAVSLTGQISPMTDEQGRFFVLTNRSGKPCVLDGYPRVSLYKHARRLPFVYRDTSSRLGVSSQARPSAVVMHAHSTAYFLVAKSACSLQGGVQASGMRVSLPNGSRPLRITFPAEYEGAGVSSLDYCAVPPGEKAPGPENRVQVSPFISHR
jgi:hypothetical protein